MFERIWCSLSLCLAIAAAACAQSLSGSVEGQVLDVSSAAMVNAEVIASRPETGVTLRSRSRRDGSFRVDRLTPGRWRLTISYPGFNTWQSDVTVESDAVVRLKAVLSAGSVLERVDVSANSELLQPARATNSSTLSTKQLESLPAASRNYTHLIVAEAGVSAPLPDRTGRGMNLATAPGAQGDDGTQSLNPSVNGARPTNNSLMVNGMDATNMMNGSGSLGNNLNIPLDALEAVEVQTALYSASSGRNGGANIAMITRVGTNQFHGSVSHFLQNEKFNANEFFLNRAGSGRPKFRRNETYAGFGGPVIRNKTFFFAAVQRTDFTSGFANRAIATTAVPEGLGDARTRASIAEVANRWLASGAQDNPQFAGNFLTAIRRFPADQIPGLERQFFADVSNPMQPIFRQLSATDIHPVAINVLNAKRNGRFLLPSATAAMQPLTGNASFGRERILTQSFPTFFNSWSGSASIEHNFASNDRLRLNYIRSAQFVEEAFGWANSSPSPTQGQTPGYVASLSHLHNFGASWINELRGGFFELFNTRIALHRDFTNSSLGIFNPLEGALGGLASLMPTIDISTQRSTSGIGNAWDFFDRQRTIYVSDTVTHIRGKHSFQFGAELRRPTIAGEYMARTNGDLDFDNWVLFFTGHGAAGGGSDLDQGDTRRHFKMRDLGLFFQDDWRVRPGLTFNIGVRYDYFSYPVDTEGRIGSFFTKEMAQRAGLPAGLYIPQNSKIFNRDFNPLQIGLVVSPGVPWNLDQVHKAPHSSTIYPDRNNIAPRFGFAWQPRGFEKLVVRGGYGIYFERPSGSFKTDLQLSAPFFIYQNVPAPLDFADPYPRLNVNPFQVPLNVTIFRNEAGAPSWRRFDGSPFPATEPFSAKNYTFVDPFIRTPYVQQWTLNLQFEPAKGNLFDVRYVGTRGVKLMAKVNLAQALDPRESPINGFNSIRTSTGALINPDFFVPSEFLGLGRANGFRLRSNWAASTYHGLQVTYRRRVARSLMGNFGYTWAKTIDNISSDGGVVEHDARRIANNRGPADFDRTHRFTAAYVYDLPAVFGGANVLLRRLLHGWALNGLITLQSGSPFSVTGAATANAYWAQVGRVRVDFAPGKGIQDARKSGPVQDRMSNFFDPTVFANSEDRWGNTGRNILRGPVQRQFDFAVARSLPIKEQRSIEFRWEIFNAFNQATFSNPVSALPAAGTGTAGLISSTIGGPRTMQIALRLRF